MEYVISQDLWNGLSQTMAELNVPARAHNQIQEILRQVGDQTKREKKDESNESV